MNLNIERSEEEQVRGGKSRLGERRSGGGVLDSAFAKGELQSVVGPSSEIHSSGRSGKRPNRVVQEVGRRAERIVQAEVDGGRRSVDSINKGSAVLHGGRRRRTERWYRRTVWTKARLGSSFG